MNSAIKALSYLGGLGYDKRQLDYQEFVDCVARAVLSSHSYDEVLEVAKLSHYINKHWDKIEDFASDETDLKAFLEVDSFQEQEASDGEDEDETPFFNVFLNQAFGGKKDYALISFGEGGKPSAMLLEPEGGLYSIFSDSEYCLKFSKFSKKASIYRVNDGLHMGDLVYSRKKFRLKNTVMNLALYDSSRWGFTVYHQDYLRSVRKNEEPDNEQSVANIFPFFDFKKPVYNGSNFFIDDELATDQEYEFCFYLALAAAKLSTDITKSKKSNSLAINIVVFSAIAKYMRRRL